MAKAKKTKSKKKIGRPTKYTKTLADKICSELAMGRSLRTICEPDDMPDKATVFRWLRSNKAFRDQYVLAKDDSAHADDETLQDIGDEAIKESKKVGVKRANAVVNAYKLKADNLKWAMSKKMPKKYGDKLDLTSKGKVLPTPIYGGNSIQKHDGNKKDISADEKD